jgi:hypothetical protein
MSKTFTKKTRTTYRPSTHPRWAKCANRNPVLEMEISIEVSPAPTYDELCVMQTNLASCGADEDKLAFLEAINREVNRCKPKPVWMQRANQSNIPPLPTQHARIDGTQVDLDKLKGILKPETLRRTFISILALMGQIQADIQSAPPIQKTQAEVDAEASEATVKARRL